MHDDSLERSFARFRDDGDPDALAAVFDATAPRLLLVAAHVTPDPAAAEDLVQETFLQAMQRAGQYRDERALLPWLCAILRNRATDLARRQRVRRTAADGTDRVAEAVAAGGGPAERADLDELLERVDAALQEVESPFREALVLRIVHGLEPTAIAHALGRNPSTVRVQLKRGLERLRVALPAGVAGALAALLLPGRGVAAMRGAVLDRAASIHGAAAGSGAGEVAAASAARRAGLLLTLGAAVVLGATAFLTRDAWRGAPAAGGGAGATSGTVTPIAAGGAAGEARGEAPPADRAAAGGPSDIGATTLRGRLVDALDGAPLAGGTVTASFGRGRFVTDDPTFRTYPDPVAVDVGADGTFALTFVSEPKVRVSLRVDAPGHAASSTSWPSVRAGLDHDLGDVALVRSGELRARVVDADGAPVPGVAIRFTRRTRMADLGAATFDTWSSRGVTSGAGGQLPPAVVPAPGRYEVAAAYDEHEWRVVSPDEVAFAPNGPRVVDAVVVVAPAEPGACIAGRVVDEVGRPVAGVTLCLDAQMLDMGQATSAVDGTFRLAHDLPARAYELHVPTTDLRYRLVEPDREYETGAADALVRVRALPTHAVAVDVVDGRDGAPVERFGLRHELDYWGEERQLSIPPERFYWPIEAERHAGGRALLEDLPPGRYRLNVHPADRALATAYMVAFEVTEDGAAPVRVTLQPKARLVVRVVDDRGAPRPHTKVRLVHTMATGGRFSSLFSVEELARGVGAGRKMAIALQTASTDGDGRASFDAPTAEPRLLLVVGGVGVLGIKRELEPVPREGAERAVTVPATATVRGRVGPEVFVAGIAPDDEVLRAAAIVRPEDSELPYACPQLWLLGADGARGGKGPLLPDGTFVIDDAAPGDWRLVLDVEWRGGNYRVHDAPLASIDGLVAGEVRRVDVDAAELLPATLGGEVRVDGAPSTAGALGLLGGPGDEPEVYDVALSPRATFETALHAGRYLPFVRLGGDGGDDDDELLFLDRRVELVAGAVTRRRFAFERRAVRLTLRGPAGEAAAGLAVDVRAIDFPEVHARVAAARQSDDAGVVVLDPAPPGRLVVTRRRDGALLGEVVAGPDRTTRATLAVPR